MVIPAELRRSLGVEAGDQVVLDLKDGSLRVRSLDAVIRRVQERVRRYVPDHVSLVDELMADRRAEAARESKDEALAEDG
jgi:AbrB family looped-hinge helix DNA binding protein